VEGDYPPSVFIFKRFVYQTFLKAPQSRKSGRQMDSA